MSLFAQASVVRFGKLSTDTVTSLLITHPFVVVEVTLYVVVELGLTQTVFVPSPDRILLSGLQS